MRLVSVLSGVLVIAGVSGHPGHNIAEEVAVRRDFLSRNRNDLSHCTNRMRSRGLEQRSIERRATLATKLFKRDGLQVRQISSLKKPHKSTKNYTIDTDAAVVFSGNKSCVLNPEATEGPYYVAGESVRQDVVEDQVGVPLTIDVQVVDVETCEPVTAKLLEIWRKQNPLLLQLDRYYGGVTASGNGVWAADPSNLDSTFLRGFQKTDEDGAVQFQTIFPGHYIGRTIHIHVMVHPSATAHENGSVIDTSASHVGQMYFDQDLITEIEKLAPYNTNRQALTTNAQDFILAGEAATADPLMEYTLLGDRLEDGLLAWLSIGVNTSYTRTVSAAATVYKEGGKANSNGLGGGGFPGGGGGGLGGGFGGGFGGTP
ncbi:Intradiol ring-cleavage dioxygenase [Phialemonium atrogriseum]|uniref:Intradiol ring-cleavage dioxygenase n=1 Tax=Phialemonium atrogriseum TaxID=1093897 RepID=A0AAJ0CCZ4_9PEZI|nr:Intradiol ring-cleavage dioxygenase [Phialemonium atrogriseum]KAK1772056.1 Intradiol ring-cleavage dioxygenase [Phialemonium atrogriseum]